MDRKLSRSLVLFAAKFCNELDKTKTSICSPLSAETVLALLALGCKKKSRSELLKALGMRDDDAIRSSFSYLISTLKGIEGATLNMANKVYLQKGGTLKPGIKKDAEEVFESDFEQLDFKEKEAAADVINKWVATQTNDLIQNIVSAEMIKKDTSIILVNAIYFKGTWETAFDKNKTCDRTFHVNNNTEINVPQMYMSHAFFSYKASKGLKAKLLRMNYKGGNSNMVIVLPNEVEGLSSVMKQLAAGHDLMADIAAMKMTTIDVAIPKFKKEMTIDLNNLLPKLGIKTIFDEKAAYRDGDIDMLTSGEKLYVSNAIQKAFIEVDEAGTEAAAVTVTNCQVPRSSFRPPNPQFIADKPFLYLLLTQEIPLFIGVYEGSEYGSISQMKKQVLVTPPTSLRHQLILAGAPPPHNFKSACVST